MVPSGPSATPLLTALTPKGRRGAARLLAAATVVLARDGYAGASLRAVAEEAAMDKRNVLYYYGTREALLVRVVQDVGERIAAAVEGALSSGRPAEDVVDALWNGITAEPELARAYVALLGGGAGAPEVEEALSELKQRYLRLLRDTLPLGRAQDSSLLYFAVLRGLLLEWAESGETADLRESLKAAKALIARD